MRMVALIAVALALVLWVQQSGALHPAASANSHVQRCSSPSTTGTAPSRYNTTPPGSGPWQVPVDPCNTEAGHHGDFYENCAYWAAEKRPDIWVNAVWKYGYARPGGGWDVELDAKKAGYPINHSPQPGDIVAWPPNAVMGSTRKGTTASRRVVSWFRASPGGHVAYVESVNGYDITISEMGSPPFVGGDTETFEYNPRWRTSRPHHACRGGHDHAIA
jgi:surface antigen